MTIDCVVVGYNWGFGEDRKLRSLVDDSSGNGLLKKYYQRELVKLGDRWMNPLAALSSVRSNVGDPLLYSSFEVPNTAAYYLASYLLRSGHSCEIVNQFNCQLEEFQSILQYERPSIVAITTTFYFQVYQVREIVNVVRQYSPDSAVVVGGPLLKSIRIPEMINLEMLNGSYSFNASGSFSSSELDEMDADVYVIESQGERALERIVSVGGEYAQLYKIPNLVIPASAEADAKQGKPRRWYRTKIDVENNSLDEHVIDWSHFTKSQLGPTIQTRTARSCAFKCKFCNYPTTAGPLNFAEISTVEKELKQLSELGVENVIFVDDTFNVPVSRFNNICEMIIRNNFDFRWFSYFRAANARNEKTYDLMQKSGCAGVFLGIESGDAQILSNMAKASSPERYLWGIERLKERDIISFAAMMVGFPGETEETVNNSIQFMEEASCDYFTLNPWFYVTDTPIAKDKDKYGLVGKHYDWKHDTMDVSQAFELTDYFYDKVRNSNWMPSFHHDFWVIPYLFGKGFNRSQLAEFHSLLRPLFDHNSGLTNAFDYQRDISAFKRYCTTLKLESPTLKLPNEDQISKWSISELDESRYL